jgi:hypothetical protein
MAVDASTAPAWLMNNAEDELAGDTLRRSVTRVSIYPAHQKQKMNCLAFN